VSTFNQPRVTVGLTVDARAVGVWRGERGGTE
jgi:hypothetical protein